MIEEQLDNGDWLWTFTEQDDGDIFKLMKQLAEKYDVQLNSPQFDLLFNTVINHNSNLLQFLESLKQIKQQEDISCKNQNQKETE
jgi:hypothetical protein